MLIATSAKNVLIKPEAWDKAHAQWFAKAAEELNDPSVKEWTSRKEYFRGVDEVMRRLEPEATDEERTRHARKRYFDAVVSFVRKHPESVRSDVIEALRKTGAELAVVTTNTNDALDRLLEAADAEGLYSVEACSLPDEKDDAAAVFERFVAEHGLPDVFVAREESESAKYFREKGVRVIVLGDASLLSELHT